MQYIFFSDMLDNDSRIHFCSSIITQWGIEPGTHLIKTCVKSSISAYTISPENRRVNGDVYLPPEIFQADSHETSRLGRGRVNMTITNY